MITELRVGGVHCANCVRSVTSALQQVPAVQHVSVELLDAAAQIARARILGDAPRDALVGAVRAAGYQPLAD